MSTQQLSCLVELNLCVELKMYETTQKEEREKLLGKVKLSKVLAVLGNW